MYKRADRSEARVRRHVRLRKKIAGTTERPRLSVFRSLHHIYAQIIDDTKGITLMTVSTVDTDIKSQVKSCGNIDAAKAVGAGIAKKALQNGIKAVVFDRGGYIYHGRIKALAEAARENGLEF